MLLPGMTANVSIVTDRREDVLRVPNDAARFSRPAPAEETSTAATTHGGAQRGGNFMNEQMMRELGLSKEQQEKLQKALQAVFQQQQAQQSTRAGWPGGAGQPGISSSRMPRTRPCATASKTTLASVLTPEQMEKLGKLGNQRGGRYPHLPARWTLVDGKPMATWCSAWPTTDYRTHRGGRPEGRRPGDPAWPHRGGQ